MKNDDYITLFEEYQKQAKFLFGHYSETFNVKNVVIDDHVELETKYTYGAKWDGNILYISNNVTEDVIRYILAREAFFSISSTSSRSYP